MRILQVEKFYRLVGGAPKYALMISDLLKKAGHTVVPFATKDKRNLPTQYDRFFVDALDFSTVSGVSFKDKLVHGLNIIYSRRAKRSLEKLLEVEEIDIAHLHNIYHHISPSILPVLKKHKIPVVMTLHDYKLISPNYSMYHHGAVHEEDSKGWYLSCVKNKCFNDSRLQSALVTAEMIFHHKIMRYFERYVDVFLAPSMFMRDLCIARGWSPDRIVHAPLPIDPSLYEPSYEAGECVTYVGRLTEEKGLEVLLGAAEQLSHIPFVIVGTGPLETKIKHSITEKGLKNITLTGFLQGEKLQSELRRARLVVVPSVWYENYPLSILEAKAMGKVVLGSRIGGIPEQLPEELLVEPGSVAAWSEAIERWFNVSEESRGEMGRKLRTEVELNNNPVQHQEMLIALYEKLLHNR